MLERRARSFDCAPALPVGARRLPPDRSSSELRVHELGALTATID
ncbi:MAG TPA: hypothetical protein VG869_16820 [Acidimicrobiia bacterium]|nr:hypothetical protein [Acidimicrobiia bacterium]